MLRQQPGVPAVERALEFVDDHGLPFGLSRRTQLRHLRSRTDRLGFEHVRFEQVHRGVPVTAGEFLVHLNGARVVAANGAVLADLPDDVTPTVDPDGAREAAARLLALRRADVSAGAVFSDPRLEILNRGLIEQISGTPSRLAWFIEASAPALREFIWVDARTGGVLLHFSQLTDARQRRVHSLNQSSDDSLLPGSLVRTEAQGATGDADTDRAYDHAGATYDYFLQAHGRDSFDNAGAALISTVHYGVNYANAFWNGAQVVYGAGYAAADDVVAHEFTHALTERTANLFYYMQSGALNESFSDIFGEIVDLQTSTGGNDSLSARWYVGEDLPNGAIRNMMNPTIGGDPGKMSDPEFWCTRSDGGGVHSNSGVPNHAFALMVDGGTYNNRTISGIGITKAAQVQYRALTTYLTSGSGFTDAVAALNQACTDLTGTSGITASDCAQVSTALQAVEMDQPWACASVATPAVCATGTPSYVFQETWEGSSAKWTTTSAGAGVWTTTPSVAKDGKRSAYGQDPEAVSDHSLLMVSGVTIPAGGRLHFASLFDFDSGSGRHWDGGVIEYSAEGGAWTDAGSLIEAGQRYGGTLNGDANPLNGRQAFVASSYGFTATRLDVSSLAGQSVRFRFRIGSDTLIDGLGWLVDNVGIYSCSTAALPVVTASPSNVTVRAGGTASFSAAAASTPPAAVQWQSSADGTTWTNVPGGTAPTLSFVASASDSGRRYRAAFSNAGGSVNSASALLTVRAVSGSDFDGDGRTDLAVYRSGTGTWHARGQMAVTFGERGDLPVLGDYNGDGTTDLAVYRPSTGTWQVRAQFTRQFGQRSDIPVPGDYDGDGDTDLAVYRPSTGMWYVENQPTVEFGGRGYLPVPADYNGDGRTDIAVYDRTNGRWYVKDQFYVQFGDRGDRPVPADYNGDGAADVAVYRPGTASWFVRGQFATTFGAPGDQPVPRDYNGDGSAELAVFRPETAEWLVFGQPTVQFGAPGDLPVPRQALPRAAAADYDGDRLSDVSVFRPSLAAWYVKDKLSVRFGETSDKPVPADYDGDGIIDPAVFRPAGGTWIVRNGARMVLGQSGDIPVPGDYNGDGAAEPAIYRPSTGSWHTRYDTPVFFGDAGDIPVPADYDGDGSTDIAVYRPSTGMWYVRNQFGFQFGDAGDQPVAADFDGDGRADLAVYRPSTGMWYVRNQFGLQFGDSGDMPVPGDFNGDGRMDVAVYRPSTGMWYVRSQFAVQFGDPTDLPLVPGGSR